MRRGLTLLVPALILATACTSSSDGDDGAARTTATDASGEAAASTVDAAPAASSPPAGQRELDRIVVATDDGRIYHVDPTGADRVDLVGDGEPAGSQPVWSPDGRRVGWSEVSPEGFGITTADVDGGRIRRAASPIGGYYGYWDPTSSLLGFLGNAPAGTGLVLADGSGTDIADTVDSDTFYFFSWSPDGRRWVVNSGSGVRIVGLDDDSTPIDVDPAAFRAPTWAADGTIILAIARGDGSTIVRYDPDTGDTDELLDVGPVANFVLDPTGRKLAVESFGVGTPDRRGEQRAFRNAPAPSAEVIVHDLATGSTEQVLDTVSGGFWWSPDGTKLAVLTGEIDGSQLWNRWLVWSDGDAFVGERITITPTYARAYVPFFDQYAQSVTPWSPDSRSFVYTGADESGAEGVFVQRAERDTPAVRITDDGAVAFWSPT